jgi:hypothetical protein
MGIVENPTPSFQRITKGVLNGIVQKHQIDLEGPSRPHCNSSGLHVGARFKQFFHLVDVYFSENRAEPTESSASFAGAFNYRFGVTFCTIYMSSELPRISLTIQIAISRIPSPKWTVAARHQVQIGEGSLSPLFRVVAPKFFNALILN